MLNEDFERESQKEFVYLLEAQILMEQEFERIPAKIIIVDKESILKQDYEYKGNTLPL
jgi:hypothetical protein